MDPWQTVSNAEANTLHFNCTGCGKCCTGHHVPLTLSEARQWVDDGGQVIVLVEAFLDNGLGLPVEQQEHARRRSCAVPCGATDAFVAITFAAFNPGPCRNLDADLRCLIYERRPLVCRIYPMEINPHIPLRPEAKDCPPEAWESGDALIHRERVVDPQLLELIERSRQADRQDIRSKALVCQRLGIDTSALKGNGFTAYLPDTTALRQAMIETASDADAALAAWTLHVEDGDLAGKLSSAGARVTGVSAGHYSFIGF
ncbi:MULTISPECIES: YkgJ family cysteine cluster protein [unclassified Pseudomonas]|jgi:Fe-S-cluster containining protein|uniref:YkgJ family cysteine cluster protein n=1 Tax=unclassified Pseudomonas TaxID=196821 RepID=UPI000BA3158D|nr:MULTISPECIES: YkgJ family cysteine cluster protein [unclassified Pseudomonas]MCU1732994.1 YkgJ family cysteine cluster protein [Pseudomonas sp. 20P_3.2_Bac4]MCU1743379.1 YkgJ family cysteine cluster protein [Pseudomonas sp. 20P_3.2_Bac5]